MPGAGCVPVAAARGFALCARLHRDHGAARQEKVEPEMDLLESPC